MRICGNRASSYTQEEINTMLDTKDGPDGKRLTLGQRAELQKTRDIRGGHNSGHRARTK